MSSRVLGVIPKSGEKMLKDALGQFKGIISQIKEGVKKVQAKVAKNTTQMDNIKKQNDVLVSAVDEAVIVAANLESMLSGKISMLPVEDDTVTKTVDTDKSEGTTSDKPE